jgi:hypothetical protein
MAGGGVTKPSTARETDDRQFESDIAYTVTDLVPVVAPLTV